MLNVFFKKIKKIELRRRICTVAATERFERMDILSGQNVESVNIIGIALMPKIIYALGLVI